MTTNSSDWMIRLSRECWSLVSAADPSAIGTHGTWTVAESPALAEAVTNYFADQQIAPSPILISLDGSLCLSTSFTVASTRQLRKRDALLFQLEETLPVSAEEVVADFTARQRAVFAVAAEIAVLEPVIVELTKAGLVVEAVVPEVILATEEHLRAGAWPAWHRVLWLEREYWELVTVDGHRPTSWQQLPPNLSSLLQTLRAAELTCTEPLPLVAYGPPELIVELDSHVSAEWLSPVSDGATTNLTTQAGSTAAQILAGQTDPTLQLLRGTLLTSVKRRSPLVREWRLVQCAAALLLIVVGAAQFSARQSAHRDLAARTTAQADVFRELYPDKRVPLGVQTRLASDLRRLRGVRGDTTELPAEIDAIRIVQQVLAALPTDMRFRLLELRVENGRLSLSGEVRSHGDADRIAAALRKQGLRVSPPSTQQLPQQGVDFRLTAEVAPPEEKSV